MTPAELRSLPAVEPPAEGTAGAGATITPYEDGPLLVRGDFALTTPDGESIETGRRTVALCRCGKSALKPFCDGTHKVAGFRAPAGPIEQSTSAAVSSTRPSRPATPETP